MSLGITDMQHYSDIADAIRAKNGTATTYKPEDMATAISNIPSGGGTNKVSQTIIHSGTTKYIPINDTDTLLTSATTMLPYRNGTKVRYNPTGLTQFRWVCRFQITAIPSANTWYSFFGNSNRKCPRFYYMQISGDTTNIRIQSEWEDNTSTRFHTLSDKPINTWFYVAFVYDNSIDTKCRLYVYDDTRTLIDTSESSAMGTLNTTTYDLNIGTADGTTAMTFRDGKVDYGQTFFEINNTVIWGNKTAENGNMGVIV